MEKFEKHTGRLGANGIQKLEIKKIILKDDIAEQYKPR